MTKVSPRIAQLTTGQATCRWREDGGRWVRALGQRCGGRGPQDAGSVGFARLPSFQQLFALGTPFALACGEANRKTAICRVSLSGQVPMYLEGLLCKMMVVVQNSLVHFHDCWKEGAWILNPLHWATIFVRESTPANVGGATQTLNM